MAQQASALTAQQALLRQWIKLRSQYPTLTRGVGTDFTNTLPYEGQTYQQGLNQHSNPLIEMDPLQAASLPAATNQYAIAHELGHANEPRFINTYAKANTYNAVSGPKPGAGQGYGVVAHDKWGLDRGASNGQTPANEYYAADFAGALGRKWPNGPQLKGRTLKRLQALRILPKGHTSAKPNPNAGVFLKLVAALNGQRRSAAPPRQNFNSGHGVTRH